MTTVQTGHQFAVKSWLRLRWIHTGFFVCVIAVLLASRRWAQWLHPQVWNEDGVNSMGSGGSNLTSFIVHGWAAVFESVNGYLIVVPKLISFAALQISFLYYAAVSTALAWVFIGGVAIAIWRSPTLLKGRLVCAVTVFCLPCDPEVFGLPLYTFWWASLLLFLVVLWREDDVRLTLRTSFLLLAGLSSPVVVLVAPLMAWRWLRSRTRSDGLLLLLISVIAFVQLRLMLQHPSGGLMALPSAIRHAVPTFFGGFVLGNWNWHAYALWLAGLICAAVILRSAWLKRDFTTASLLFLLAGAIAMAAVRVDVAAIHPALAGPRYFFFPFILIGWLLVRTVTLRGYRLLQLGAAGLLAASVINALPAWSRTHDDLSWSRHVAACTRFTEYAIPIQFNGDAALAWELSLTGAQCRALLARSWIASDLPKRYLTAPPFSVATAHPSPHRYAGIVLQDSLHGADFYKSSFDGVTVLGSYVHSDADQGQIKLKLLHGDRILFRTGPDGGSLSLTIDGRESRFAQSLPLATDWKELVFSNLDLPAEFTVTVSDHGSSHGQWFALGIGTPVNLQ